MAEINSLIPNLLSALSDLASFAALILGWLAFGQWKTVRKADAAEAGLAQLDQLKNAFSFVRNPIFLAELCEPFQSQAERRKRVSELLGKRWQDRHVAIVQETFRIGRLCEFRLGQDGPRVYEIFQKLRRHCDEARDAAFALGLEVELANENRIWSAAVHDQHNDPLKVTFDVDAQALDRILHGYIPASKRRKPLA